jgi:DNA-binding transcriptional regulator YdaS (Cro superfamily)
MASKINDKRRALALSSGLGRTVLVFDVNDVADLLRIAVEREGSQQAFARHHGINRSQLNTILTGRRAVGAAIAELIGLRKAYIVNDKRRALALSSRLGRTVVFDDNDVVDLLRIAVEREGGQHAFARRSGVNYAYLNRVLNGKEPPGRSIAKSLGLRKVYIVK